MGDVIDHITQDLGNVIDHVTQTLGITRANFDDLYLKNGKNHDLIFALY